MKKVILGLAFCSGLLLAGCSSDTPNKSSDTNTESATDDSVENVVLKDGTYKLEEKNYNNIYRYILTIDIKNNTIDKVDFDAIDKEGNSKREDESYIKMMEEQSGTSPDKFLDELQESLLEKQNPDDVDTVTGATHTTDSFKEYAKELIKQAEKGDTSTIIVDNKN